MKLNDILVAALIVGFAGAAVAEQNQFFIVQDKDKNCRIIEGKPDVVEDQTMKVGKQSYPTREEAEVDIKVVCVKPQRSFVKAPLKRAAFCIAKARVA